MTQEYFDAPLFIRECERTEVNLSQTPFFCNIGERPVYVKKLPDDIKEVKPATGKLADRLGTKYQVSAKECRCLPSDYGEQTRLELVADTVVYKAMRATAESAAAFGMVLVERGQGIRVSSPVPKLSQIDYEYGMYAGHRSPYRGTGYSLLNRVCTDLECHGFPHVFAAIDPHLPLVISVGRYWPNEAKIYLADLWVPCGSALYVPPKPEGQSHLDLHGNRNSALACWRGWGPDRIRTQTLLQVDGGFFHWFWNDLPTKHPLMSQLD